MAYVRPAAFQANAIMTVEDVDGVGGGCGLR
jgi:hypothetical protein